MMSALPPKAETALVDEPRHRTATADTPSPDAGDADGGLGRHDRGQRKNATRREVTADRPDASPLRSYCPPGRPLTLTEVANIVQLPPKVVVEYVRRAELAGQQIGRRWTFSQAAVDAFLEPMPDWTFDVQPRGMNGAVGGLAPLKFQNAPSSASKPSESSCTTSKRKPLRTLRTPKSHKSLERGAMMVVSSACALTRTRFLVSPPSRPSGPLTIPASGPTW
jgi:hypothetical protein